MLSGGNEKSLQIKQNDKFFSRLLSKENSSNSISAKAESSFRVLYYGGACGAVPFTWESQPGTPKHPSSDYSSLPPPLTPPPSFQFRPKSNSKSKSKSIQKPSKPIGGKPNFLFTIFPRTASKKNHVSSPSLSSSSISSSSCSSRSFSSPSTTAMNPYVRQNRCLWRSRSTVCFGVEDDDGEEEEEEEAGGSPTSTFCFGTFSSSKDLRASRSRVKMKFPL